MALPSIPPRLVAADGRRIYTCAVCGRQETWRHGWLWWPSVSDQPMTDPEPLLFVCSADCAAATPYGRP